MAKREVTLEVTSLGVLTFISILIVSTYAQLQERNEDIQVGSGCEFKSDWTGSWYVHGTASPISINSTWIENKGRCVATREDQFVVEDPSEGCFKCLVIHEKHTNVLQFKETYCDTTDNIDTLCSQLGGDALLYSLFRTEPLHGAILCPFKGPPFTFSYTRGSSECSSPPSRIDSCTDESRLSLKYQACPDVRGTESIVEELECIASWKDSSSKYLIAKILHTTAQQISNELYRCYVYDRLPRHDHRIEYRLSQSGDPSCNGLLSTMEGTRVLKLYKVDNTHTKCKYPSWVTEHHHWHTLDYKRSYHFSHKNATLKITEDVGSGNARALSIPGTTTKKSNPEMRIVCHSEVKTDSHVSLIIAHITKGCESGYICVAFYRRDSTVIELQQSATIVENADDACKPQHFNPSKLPFITLITATLHQRKCPHLGRYSLVSQTDETEISEKPKKEEPVSTEEPVTKEPESGRRKRETSTVTEKEEVKKECVADTFDGLNIGCSGANDVMAFENNCNPDLNSEYSCYGNWEENGTYFLIASPVSRKSTEAKRYCFISTPLYEDEEGNVEAFSDRIKKGPIVRLLLSTEVGSCSRTIQPGITGIKSYNFTLVGPCAESKSSDSGRSVTVTTLLFLISILTVLFGMR